MLQVQVLLDGATVALTPINERGKQFCDALLEAFRSGEVKLTRSDGSGISYRARKGGVVPLNGTGKIEVN